MNPELFWTDDVRSDEVGVFDEVRVCRFDTSSVDGEIALKIQPAVFAVWHASTIFGEYVFKQRNFLRPYAYLVGFLDLAGRQLFAHLGGGHVVDAFLDPDRSFDLGDVGGHALFDRGKLFHRIVVHGLFAWRHVRFSLC